jgi:hypothetical protein
VSHDGVPDIDYAGTVELMNSGAAKSGERRIEYDAAIRQSCCTGIPEPSSVAAGPGGAIAADGAVPDGHGAGIVYSAAYSTAARATRAG